MKQQVVILSDFSVVPVVYVDRTYGPMIDRLDSGSVGPASDYDVLAVLDVDADSETPATDVVSKALTLAFSYHELARYRNLTSASDADLWRVIISAVADCIETGNLQLLDARLKAYVEFVEEGDA